MCIWFIGNSVSNIISGLLAYGIGQIKSSLEPWRLLFIILGAVTCAWGVLLLMFLPDSPSKAKFLTTEEKAIALHRTIENKTGVMDEGTFKIGQMFEALRDPQAWFLSLYMFAVNIGNGGVTSVCCGRLLSSLSWTEQKSSSVALSSTVLALVPSPPLSSKCQEVPSNSSVLSSCRSPQRMSRTLESFV